MAAPGRQPLAYIPVPLLLRPQLLAGVVLRREALLDPSQQRRPVEPSWMPGPVPQLVQGRAQGMLNFAAASACVLEQKRVAWRNPKHPKDWLTSQERYAYPRISAVMEWAIAMEFRTDNPCDRLGPVLGPQEEVVRNMPALP